MESLITLSRAQQQLTIHLRARRLQQGLTQEGLAKRSGVSLPTLRKFEQKGLISLESFLKLLMVLDGLEEIVSALEPKNRDFQSIDEVLHPSPVKKRKKGWRT